MSTSPVHLKKNKNKTLPLAKLFQDSTLCLSTSFSSFHTTDVQTHQSWRRKQLHVPSAASSYHRMNCCVFPARTTCPTASPRYKDQMTQKKNCSMFIFLSIHLFFSPFSSGSSYAERRLVCVSSL